MPTTSPLSRVMRMNGHAERHAAGRMLTRTERRHGVWPETLGTDAGFADGTYLAALAEIGIVPHVPIFDGVIRGYDEGTQARRRAKRRRKTRGYTISQRIRKRIEEIVGWLKVVGGLARARFIGRWKIKQQAEVTAAAYNLLRPA